MSDDSQKDEVYVDQDTCIGCALCTSMAAHTFTMNDQGKSDAHNPYEDDKDTVQEAIDSCPVHCIHWKQK